MRLQEDETERRVIAFARPARFVARDRTGPADDTGRILLFTGVQYQRLVDEPEAICPPPDREHLPGDMRIGG